MVLAVVGLRFSHLKHKRNEMSMHLCVLQYKGTPFVRDSLVIDLGPGMRPTTARSDKSLSLGGIYTRFTDHRMVVYCLLVLVTLTMRYLMRSSLMMALLVLADPLEEIICGQVLVGWG